MAPQKALPRVPREGTPVEIGAAAERWATTGRRAPGRGSGKGPVIDGAHRDEIDDDVSQNGERIHLGLGAERGAFG
ncbi:hypothetical protein, partial [Thermoflexus sp.]|uniref:hypothetical protein n=1 Tax=Thermoflexus sp. TaxID=1969742 RepID=UPI0035E43874